MALIYPQYPKSINQDMPLTKPELSKENILPRSIGILATFPEGMMWKPEPDIDCINLMQSQKIISVFWPTILGGTIILQSSANLRPIVPIQFWDFPSETGAFFGYQRLPSRQFEIICTRIWGLSPGWITKGIFGSLNGWSMAIKRIYIWVKTGIYLNSYLRTWSNIIVCCLNC